MRDKILENIAGKLEIACNHCFSSSPTILSISSKKIMPLFKPNLIGVFMWFESGQA